MDEVFTLTQKDHSYEGSEQFVYSSQNIYEIIDKMFSVGYAEIHDFQIYVTCFDGNSIPYKEWRSR